MGGTFSDNPTVTYAPLAGVDFADTLLAPLGAADIVGLALAGIPARLALGVGLHSLGDYHNEGWGTLPNAQADPQFIELVGLIDELTRGGWIALTSTAPADREAKDGKRPTFVLFRAGRPEPGLQAKVARVRELLRLDPKRNEFELIFGLGPSKDPEKIAFRTRSLAGRRGPTVRSRGQGPHLARTTRRRLRRGALPRRLVLHRERRPALEAALHALHAALLAGAERQAPPAPGTDHPDRLSASVASPADHSDRGQPVVPR